MASAGKAAYVAAKHGLLGLTKVVALETAQTPITCNAVCPGWVRTPLVEAQISSRAEASGVDFDTAMQEMLGEKMPSASFVEPRALAETVVFLCGDAAANMRGSAIHIDGGWTAQ